MSFASGKNKSLSPVELSYKNSGGRVTIVPPDSDIMAMSVETAIEACRAFHQQIVFKDQFDLLLNRLAAWVDAHREKISDAFLTARDSGLLFLVVLKGEQFDSEIETSLTELDLEISNDDDYKLISLAVHALPQSPEETIRSFISRKLSLRYRLDRI